MNNEKTVSVSRHAVRSDEPFTGLLALPTDTSDSEANAELLGLQAALGSYRATTLHWAERRSAGQASLVPAARRAERWALLPRWSLATVALVTIAGGTAHFADYGSSSTRSGDETSSTVTVRTTPASDSAADDRLLLSINAELNYHSASPVDALGLQQVDRKPVATANDGVTD